MLDEIYKIDKDFTEDKFKTFVDNIFIQIHLAIMTKELYKIEHFVSDEVYSWLLEKVDKLQLKKRIQMYDELNVKETKINSGRIIEGDMYIDVTIVSRYMDYLLTEDGEYISGNNLSRVEKENHLIFKKKINAKDLLTNRKCSSCGASLDINRNGKCDYCGTVFNLDEKSWVLVEFEVC